MSLARRRRPEGPTGEDLLSAADARDLLRYAGLRADRDVLQFDPTLAYGVVEYVRTLAAMRERSWSPRRCIPHGGHLFNVHVAAGLRLGGAEAYLDVFRPVGDLPPAYPVTNGFVSVPTVPGVGHEQVPELHAALRDALR